MICPDCKERRVSNESARECERLSWRFMCAVCLVEHLRKREWRPRPWAPLRSLPPVRMAFVSESLSLEIV